MIYMPGKWKSIRDWGELSVGFQYFRFNVSALNRTSPITYDFRIQFISVSVKVFQLRPFVLNNTDQEFFKIDNLLTWTFPEATPIDQITYEIVSPPKLGYIDCKQLNFLELIKTREAFDAKLGFFPFPN